MKQQSFGEIDQKLDTVPSQGAIAQLVERFHGMEEVRGSIPLSSTTKVCGACSKHSEPDEPYFRPFLSNKPNGPFNESTNLNDLLIDC